MHKPSHQDFSCLMNMLDSISRIQDYSANFKDADDFYGDSKSFDASMMNFIIIGEMAEKLSENLLNETAKDIDWLKVRGFRNIIAHNYFGIDAEEVWQIIQGSLIKLKKDLENLVR